jgi:hypothetical protein
MASCEHYMPASHMVCSTIVHPFILILLTLDALFVCCATQYRSSEGRNHFLCLFARHRRQETSLNSFVASSSKVESTSTGADGLTVSTIHRHFLGSRVVALLIGVLSPTRSSVGVTSRLKSVECLFDLYLRSS